MLAPSKFSEGTTVFSTSLNFVHEVIWILLR